MFANAYTPVLSHEQIVAWAPPQPLATTQNAELGTGLARYMRAFPALKVFGLSLQGDVESWRGNEALARRGVLRGGSHSSIAVSFESPYDP